MKYDRCGCRRLTKMAKQKVTQKIEIVSKICTNLMDLLLLVFLCLPLYFEGASSHPSFHLTEELILRHLDCEIIHIYPGSSQLLPETYNQRFMHQTHGHISIQHGAHFDYKRHHDIHRFGVRQCTLALVLIEPNQFTNIPGNMTSWLFETLTRRYAALIRKDEDHFVFFCSPVNAYLCNTVLSSPDFGQKTKYKMAVIEEDENPQFVEIRTVNLFEPNQEIIFYKTTLSLDDDDENNTAGRTSQSLMEHFPSDPKNYHMKEFRIANPKVPFYFEVTVDSEGNFHGKRGLYKIWLDTMGETFNFTYMIFQSGYSGGTGILFPNGTWVGAVGDVLYGYADMAVFIAHIYNRHEFVDWCLVTYEWMDFYNHGPRTFYVSTTIFRPLTLPVWTGFFVSVAVTAVTIKLLAKRLLSFGAIKEFSIKKVLWYLYATTFELDGDMFYSCTTHTIRMFLIFWILFAMVMTTAYRGKLIGIIAFPDMTWIPTTYETLAYSDFRVALNILGKGGASYSMLSSAMSATYQKLFSRMEFFPKADECILETMLDDMGCIMWQGAGQYFKARNFTDINGMTPVVTSKEPTAFIVDGYIWEKRAVFRSRLEPTSITLHEMGLIGFWHRNDLKEVSRQSLKPDQRGKSHEVSDRLNADAADTGPKKLKLIQFKGLFVLVGGGLMLGMIAFIGEFLSKTSLYYIFVTKLVTGKKGIVRRVKSSVEKW